MSKANLGKPYKITVCSDGFVSISEKIKSRRQGAALPAHSVSEPWIAFELIRRLCVLQRCDWGGKVGVLIEPRVLSWPQDATASDILAFGEQLAEEEEERINNEKTLPKIC